MEKYVLTFTLKSIDSIEYMGGLLEQSWRDNGEAPGTRTQHLLLKRQLLYRMS